MLSSFSKSCLAVALGGILALATGCLGGVGLESAEDNGATGGVDDGGGGGAPEQDPDDGFGGAQQCTTPSDCVLAASTCCECPSFAAPEGQGYDAGCDAVDCEAPAGLCPAVEATCDGGECVMICSPVITNKTCAFGFVRDQAGCLTNECASPPSDMVECESDSECVQIPADCCGCSQGGEDRGAPESDADALLAALDCPANPACPGIDVCDADQVPRCITGTCVLAAESVNPQPDPASTQLCGTPQLEICAEGTVCVLNEVSSKEANDLGVGSCAAE